MQDIADYFQQRKTISWCLQQDKELWDKIDIRSEQDQKSEEVLKLYYYKCYEPIRQKMYPQKNQLNEFEQDIVGFAASRDFTQKYLNSSHSLSSKNKMLIFGAISMATATAGCFVSDDVLKFGAGLGAIGSALITAHFARKQSEKSTEKVLPKAWDVKTNMSKNGFFNSLNAECEDFYIVKHFKYTHNKQKSGALTR